MRLSLITLWFLAVVGVCFDKSLAGNTSNSPENVESESPSLVDNSEDEASDLDYIKAKKSILEQRWNEAVSYFEKAIKKDPKSAHLNNEIAKAYVMAGDIEKAVVAARIAVEKEPKSIEYQFSLAEVLTSAKNFLEAKKTYMKVLELDPTHQRAGILVAMLDSEMGDDNKAIDGLTKLIRENPDNSIALFYRARIFIEKNKLEEAKADLEKCLQQRPSFVEAGTALGLILEKNNELDEAIQVYSKIQGQGPFKKRLGFLHLQKNQLNEALEALSEYEESQPDDYTARVKVGLLHFELKNYEKAKEKFQKILKEQPGSDNVAFYLGWVYQAQKQWNLALGEFKKINKDSTLYQEAMLRVGYIYKETQRFKEGLAFSDQLIKKHKEVAEFYDLKASIYESQKQYKKALDVIEQGLKQVKNDERLLYFQGAILDKVGKSAEALSIMKKLVEIQGDNAHALNFIAYYYAERGENLAEAEEKAAKALTLRPNDGYITDTLAWVKFKKGEVTEALEKLKIASELIPDEAIVYEHLGDVYMAKQEKTKAVEAYKKAAGLAKDKDKEMVKKVESKVAAIESPNRPLPKQEIRVPSTEESKSQ